MRVQPRGPLPTGGKQGSDAVWGRAGDAALWVRAPLTPVHGQLQAGLPVPHRHVKHKVPGLAHVLLGSAAADAACGASSRAMRTSASPAPWCCDGCGRPGPPGGGRGQAHASGCACGQSAWTGAHAAPCPAAPASPPSTTTPIFSQVCCAALQAYAAMLPSCSRMTCRQSQGRAVGLASTFHACQQDAGQKRNGGWDR